MLEKHLVQCTFFTNCLFGSPVNLYYKSLPCFTCEKYTWDDGSGNKNSTHPSMVLFVTVNNVTVEIHWICCEV